MKALVFLLFLLVLLLPFIGIAIEKKNYNKGVCINCGQKLKLFGHDPQGGRGYMCNNCHYYTWVSYNCVDKV